MEEFLKIDWHPPLEDMIDDVFINEKRMKDESAMYRIMHGLFGDPFTEYETEDSQDEEDEETENSVKDGDGAKENKLLVQKMREYVPGIVKPSLRFPRLSNLTKEEQAACLRVMLRFSGREKPEIDSKNRSELQLYGKLCPTIHEEQEEFLDLAKANWNGSSLKIIGKEYINERWKTKVEQFKKLPRYYLAVGNVPFIGEEKISVTPGDTLLEMGQLPRVILPFNKKRNVLHCSRNKLELLYSSSNDPNLLKATVSQDPNCERLAECRGVDLVISSAGLNCLASNFGPNYNSSWILPIVVKEGGKGSVIYVDKPSPPTAMTVPQKNTWIYKYILKSELLHPNHPTSIRLSDHEKYEAADQDLFGDLNSDDLLKLEEEHDQFQSFDAKGKSIISRKQPAINDAMDSGVLSAPETKPEVYSFENVQQSLDKSYENLYKMDESGSAEKNDSEIKKVFMESVKSEDTELIAKVEMDTNDREDRIDQEMTNDRIVETETHAGRGWKGTGVPRARPPSRSNLAYKIFTLGPSADTNEDPIKTKAEEYRILVRTQIDGIERIDKETVIPVMLAPKLEHQVALGAEAVTAEEALKQWTTLTYRPNTSLLRIRISVENSEVIQIERRTAISINNEIKRLYGLNAEDSLVTLHNVVHRLRSLKPGNYLLRHTPTNGAFATIYQEAADCSVKNVFDLHSTYAQNSFQTIGNAPWPALDKVVCTPSQIYFERMPAMYYPARTDLETNSKVTRGRGRGGLRGRGRGASRGAGRGGSSQNSGGGGPRGGLRGGTRVRTKKAKKKNKGAKTETEQS